MNRASEDRAPDCNTEHGTCVGQLCCAADVLTCILLRCMPFCSSRSDDPLHGVIVHEFGTTAGQ